MFVCKCGKCVFISRIAVSYSALWLYLRVKVQLFEEQDSDLFWRKDVEIRLSRHLSHSLLDLVHLGSKC